MSKNSHTGNLEYIVFNRFPYTLPNDSRKAQEGDSKLQMQQ